jgi:hypothetical protein
MCVSRIMKPFDRRAVLNSHYAFVTRWTVACSREELWNLLEGLLSTANPMVWWPAVRVASYDGRAIAVRVRSGLGYCVAFTMHDLELRRPETLTFAATGDLRGFGTATFDDLGPGQVAIVIEWRVTVDRRWMALSGWLLRPLFVAGHHLVMRRGERRLNAWVGARN